ncbi:O-linked N-acetylglucosamine transferase, SPINDLY family protein [Limnoglobus roseus]|uniref:protein O-GlcNAc transferase n=1 Tax=Limnoglobus roseus TaxID=2598579 RepID=A0A5C1ANP0_9BACT|nr:tetratricopeptide repeat protein [Limnoglobus roseus]QEL19757.1 GT41 family glycosyltransferase [Limnoglobus roseus]
MADITQMFAAAVERHQAGDLTEAERIYRAILTTLPNHAPTLCNLGAVLARREQYEEASKCYAVCLATTPGYADAHFNLGNLYRRLGHNREAVGQYQGCLKSNPGHGSAYYNMGLSLISLGELSAAIECFRQTIAIEPQHTDAYNRLGDTLLRIGQFNDGIEQFRKYVSLRPDDPRGYNNLGLAIANAGRPQEAVPLLQKAIGLNPNYPDAYNTLALAYEALGRKDEAAQNYREAVRLNPKFADAWSNLGTNLTEQGRADEAIAALRTSLEIRPHTQAIDSNLLLTLNYSSHVSPEDVAAAHRKYGETYAPTAPLSPVPSDPDPDRRLRIGYLSGDFRQHTVAGFIELLLTNHDREKFHVSAYAHVPRPDDVTAKLQKFADRWRFVNGQTDEQAAATIQADKIDILIDLSGHTAGNRLSILAARPAPIQATLFGYPNSTGLKAVDYRITDEVSDPPGMTESLYNERLLRLAGLAWAYQPPADAPPVGPLPSLTSETFTFGCLNNAAKYSDACIDAWAKLVAAVPNAKLVLLAGQSEGGAERLVEKFTAAGLTKDQLQLLMRLPRRDYFEAYSRFDLALDPFPYNGGVTTCDALWMGVPVLTVAGGSYVSRQGASILTHVGSTEFIAESPEQLAEVAKIWASNRDMLADIRAALRPQVAKSVVADGKAYVRNLEAGLRQAWKERIKA